MEALNGSTCLSRWAGVGVDADVMVIDDDTNISWIIFPCELGNISCLISISDTDKYLPVVGLLVDVVGYISVMC